jgi:predicted alpha/beta hydrolase family esterase
MSAQFIQLSDDGKHEITIIIHGYSFLGKKPEFHSLASRINCAEIPGKVYLFHWESGSKPIPGGKIVAVLPALVPVAIIPTLVARLLLIVGYNLIKFRNNEARADKMGQYFAKNLYKLKTHNQVPITLIGHSLGCRVVLSALNHINSKKIKIRQAILLAGALEELPNNCEWKSIMSNVKKNIMNVWSPKDNILKLKPKKLYSNCFGSKPIKTPSKKLKNKKCFYGHSDYFKHFGQILDHVIQNRKRSKNYSGQVYAKCPNAGCNKSLIVIPQQASICPECNTEFEYNPKKECYYFIEPRLTLCNFCEASEFWVQDSGRYQCEKCRRWNNFERLGNRLYFS